jgi:DNA-binding GntR family transcriptional regulator
MPAVRMTRIQEMTNEMPARPDAEESPGLRGRSADFSAARIHHKLPKTAQVYDLLRAAIITTTLPPGAPITEKDICESLGVSRTPLREAIIQLAAESLVVVRPGGGTFVNLIDLREVLNGQLTRDSLEARVVRLAARNYAPEFSTAFEVCLFEQRGAAERRDMNAFFDLDNKFHKLICECSGFPAAWRTIHGTTGQLDRVKRYTLPSDDHFIESFRAHLTLYDLIKAHDEDGAARSFQDHIDWLFKEIELIKEIDPGLISFQMDVSALIVR